MREDIFYVNEHKKPYDFVDNKLPTIHDCILFVISRTNTKTKLMTHVIAVRKMVGHFEKI